MKEIIYLILYGLMINCVRAQTAPHEHQWKATLKAIDETGHPVAVAEVWVSYDIFTNRIIGLTDTNGIFAASHIGDAVNLAFHAEKLGYYPFWMQYHMGFDYDPTIWNSTQTIVLKKISQPIPMYAKRINAQPPDNGKPIGYDLMVGDWVAPYGKGINPDILFTREYNRRSLQDYDYKLTVSFPKAGDGIQEFSVPYKNMEGSALRSPHEAPTNGYQSQIVRLNMSHPGQKLIFDYDENRVYLFRVRTAIDDRGNIVSAYYGKIYGDFMQFNYYFNPTPNSRNIEFDPKQNLMAYLKPTEGVSAP
jgi:hypothetical protein